MLVLVVFLVLMMVAGAFAGDNRVRCSVGVIRGQVAVGGRGGIGMVLVRFVTVVFLDEDNLGRFMLFVLVVFGLFSVAVLSIMSLFLEGIMTVIRMERLLETVSIFTAGVGMVMGVGVTEIVAVCVLVGVRMVNRRSHVSMDPRSTLVALRRVGPMFVAIGTVLTRLLKVV